MQCSIIWGRVARRSRDDQELPGESIRRACVQYDDESTQMVLTSAASETAAQHRIGITLVTLAAVAWSTAPFFTRLLPFDSWTILFWRGIFGTLSITAVLLALQGRDGLRDMALPGRRGWLIAGLSTLGMVAYIPSLQLTSVANVAVINATYPFVTAALAWVWLKELTRRRTLLAGLMALGGIVITVGGTHASADLRGLGLAALMTLAIAAMTVAIRRYPGTSMVAAAGLSNVLGSLVSVPFADGILHVTGWHLTIFAAFGTFQVGAGLSLFMLGSRLLPSGQSALIATLESPLMPFWVWLAFQEMPTGRALVGGAIVMVAVVADILGEMRQRALGREFESRPNQRPPGA
jgi:drug/metabolite transporter (DMT)-like permease